VATTSAAVAKPFIEHVHELRQRLFVVVLAIAVGSAVGYALSDRLITILKEPLHQTLFYTTPTGAFSFVFRLSVSFGVIVALPVILYHIVRFLSPVMRHVTKRYIATMLTASLLLAAIGVVGAYFVSLPSALKFLTGFHSNEIQSLITADEYFNFVLAYLAGSALLFQLPLIMLVINRITPLKPRKLMSWERYVIAGSFIIGALLTPTPDPFNQALMSIPIIITYQIGVVIIWLGNRRSMPAAQPLFPSFDYIPEEVIDEPFESIPQQPHDTNEIAPMRETATPLASVAQARQPRVITRRVHRQPIIMDVVARDHPNPKPDQQQPAIIQDVV
jgi:sec-independent protein translocase protein TatC